ncbi:NlpC/P60 family protein [Aeromicrobium sp.]|uniref:C40 family peptidase n=1 Tax=Aeromicrobium sp. TaxID=1871063 RepID=UPI0019A41768|nr:NlpC/P60 family protein [Aeromicrobium sp.]MBC7633485.1 C40 family peptidase [Aeromicrobium sp.]
MHRVSFRTFPRLLTGLALTLTIVLTGMSGPAQANSTSPSASRSELVIKAATHQKGKPYRWGSDGPRSFDCSGLVQYVYRKAGTKIGRTSGAQLAGKHVRKHSKRKGDILIFLHGGYAYHSAIYAGKGMVWEVQRTGTRVGKHKIWSKGYVVRRPRGNFSGSR